MRSRARTVGAPFSTETATIAAQPECARKPTVACFTLRSGPVYLRAGTAARRWNLRGKTFCSLRRHAFHNLFYDFPGLCFLLRGGQHGLPAMRSEEHTSELQSRSDLVCRLLLEKKKRTWTTCSFKHWILNSTTKR